MTEYRVSWDQSITYMAFVEADSEEEAIKKAKDGLYYDVDTDPAINDKKRNFKCDGGLN